MKTKILSLFVIPAVFFACQEEDMALNTQDQPVQVPGLTFYGTGKAHISDGLKVVNAEEGSYVITLDYPEQDLKALSYEITSGHAKLYVDGSELPDNKIPVSNKAEIVIKPTALKPISILFKAADDNNKIKEAILDLNVFDNLKPTASLHIVVKPVEKPAENSRVLPMSEGGYSCYLDASGSYDQDNKFGGEIVKYHFTINGKDIYTNDGEIKYSISRGTHTITVSVQDNDGAWSSPTTRTITVE